MRRLPIPMAALLLLSATVMAAETIPSPEGFLGHKVGADRYLAPWPQVVGYFRALAGASDRVSIEVAGQSTLGNEMLVAVITSPANQTRLDRYREIASQLANPDLLSPGEAEALVAEGKVIVLVTCSIHSTEVGSTQMSMLLAHELATSDDPEVERWLDDTILLLMPSINPDGQVMVVDWYNRYLGTEYEGGRMPWLYHHYVGHDDNRDFYMLTQKETQAVNDLIYHRWFPQVFLDEHQMGSTGPRMFVPPQTDPLSPDVNSLIFAQADLLGTMMSLRLEENGKTGVGSNMIFDSYWPGGTRNTAWWKNIVGLLTEVASCRIATPIEVDPNELRGASKGLPEYQRQANFISPWPGGSWRLADIIAYEQIATKALIETCASQRARILRSFYRMGLHAAELGNEEPPYAFIVPPQQHDPVAAVKLVDLLLRHGVRIQRADEPLVVGPTTFPAGSYVIQAAQPYRQFLLTMLRPQRYPEITPYRGGPVLEPYDAATWSLPISMGVDVVQASQPVDGALSRLTSMPPPIPPPAPGQAGVLLPHAADTAFVAVNRLLAAGKPVYWLSGGEGVAPGDIFVPRKALPPQALDQLLGDLALPAQPIDVVPTGRAWRVETPKVGLYQPWTASMDEGWTRFLLERYEFPHVVLHNEEMRGDGLAQGITVLLLPDIRPESIAKGAAGSRYGDSAMPPEYRGGLGPEGAKKIEAWVRAGGTIVAMNGSTAYLIELLDLPVTDTLAKIAEGEFSCPGSMVRILLDTSHPLAFGMRAEEAAYFDGSPAFATRVPDASYQRNVVARYPADRRDILVSGFISGERHLERRAAVVDLSVGKGRVILIGFKPQNRAQTLRTFKLLFNALYLPGLRETTLE